MNNIMHSSNPKKPGLVRGPINVSWMITNRCNYSCDFCFGCYPDSELGYEEARSIVDKLVDAGLQKISLAGGEPLLWPHTEKLIAYLKRLGVQTMIISNGELITEEHLREFENTLDWLNLPLEGSNSRMNELSTRKSGHFERVQKIVEQIKGGQIKLKINTVATKINIQDIVEMVPLIREMGVRRWKIFQYYPIRGRSISNKDKFLLDQTEFEKVRKQVLELTKDDEIMVVFENTEELEDSYFSITPGGLAYVSKDGRDIILGDLKNEKVEDIWNNELLDKEKYWDRSAWFLKKGDDIMDL